MHYNLRQAGLSRYPLSPWQKPLAYQPITPVADAIHWPAKHFITFGLLLIIILSIATSGIFWKAAQLATFVPTTPLKQLPSEPVSVPAIAELAKPEPVPSPPAPVADQGLTLILNSWVANHPSLNWSIAVNGLGEDGRFASYNPDQKRGLASVYKLFLMYPLFQKVSAENFENVTVYYDTTPYKLDYCVDAMLRYSHNECGVAVGRYLGWSKVDKTYSNLGFRQTELNSDYGTQASAGDTAKLLKQLWGGSMFTDTQRQYVINILKKQTKRSGIPAGCSGCEVADKTGSLNYINNDAGIVYFANDKYVLVVFSDGAGFDSIAQLASQIQAYMKN